MSNFTKGAIFVSLGMLCWSIIEVVGSLIYQGGISPNTLLVIRFLIATPLFFVTVLIKKRRLRIAREDTFRLFVHSLFIASHLILFWYGIKTLNHVPTAITIYFSYPVWVAVLAVIFLKDRLSKVKVVSLILGILGVLFGMRILPSLSLLEVNVFGGVLMLGASLLWAAYIIIGKALLERYDQYTIVFYNFLFCLVVFLLLQNPLIILSEVKPSMFGYLAIIGVVSTYLSFLAYNTGLKYVRASTAGILGFIKPFVTIVLSLVVLGQMASLLQMFGALLTAVGIYLLYIEQNG